MRSDSGRSSGACRLTHAFPVPHAKCYFHAWSCRNTVAANPMHFRYTTPPATPCISSTVCQMLLPCMGLPKHGSCYPPCILGIPCHLLLHAFPVPHAKCYFHAWSCRNTVAANPMQLWYHMPNATSMHGAAAIHRGLTPCILGIPCQMLPAGLRPGRGH